MNRDAITIQDCIAMHDILKKAAVIENGHVTDFIREASEDDEHSEIRAYKSFE